MINNLPFINAKSSKYLKNLIGLCHGNKLEISFKQTNDLLNQQVFYCSYSHLFWFVFHSMISNSKIISIFFNLFKETNSIQARLARHNRDLENTISENLPTFNLTIPKNDPTNACIKMESAFYFSVSYQAQFKVIFIH